ncbi:MAG: DUF5069 domain-containing protein [Verrucomicrobiales bacterium]|nr:DUF5069 domain-containing protein [Verrucomicrobiales bacterium]|tara:strand:+ start:973 stop:1419 length:447 start_codon:yes stop_codon:yes gene_type:complete
MSDKYVPMISSGVAGPLGVLHLPRLWQKVSLEAAGKLADGYPGIGAGYDAMVLDALGVDHEATKTFVKDNKPTYVAFEKWIRGQAGSKVNKQNIHKLNVSILGYIHDDETRKGILSAAGVDDETTVCPDAVNLNNLDDWQEFHAAVLA